MTVDNNILIQDELTLIVVIANAPQGGVISVPSSSSDAVYCIQSLRDRCTYPPPYNAANVFSPSEHKTRLEQMKAKSAVFKYYHSWRAFVRSDPGRWRSGRIRCTGCGKHLSKHKP